MMATEQVRMTAPLPAEALREVQKQLIRIHYPRAEAVNVDSELQRRTLDRLMGLMEYVSASIEGTQPSSPMGGQK